jgi:ribosome recycling factor
VSEFAEEIITDAAERMGRAVEHTQGDFGSVRTGRATPALVEKLRVDYYGSEVPLQQLAGFSVPEARILVIQPYDATSLAAIERAIMASDLGINPGNDGDKIRLVFPPLTEERRRDLVKIVRQKAEEGKISIRNLRRSARHDLEAMEKDKEISSNELQRFENELDKHTQANVASIDAALKAKEQELLDV